MSSSFCWFIEHVNWTQLGACHVDGDMGALNFLAGFTISLLLKSLMLCCQEGFLSWVAGVSDNSIYPVPSPCFCGVLVQGIC